MYDVTKITEAAYEVINKHYLGDGAYSRWIWQDEKGQRNLGINEYGCADAVNCLYTINKLPKEYEKRAEMAKAIQSLQNPETGMFVEGTHDVFHTTAHCVAALKLVDSYPKYPIYKMHDLLEKENLERYLDTRKWSENPVIASHQAAALYAALVITGEADYKWEKMYFDWFWENTDPETGFWKAGCVTDGNKHVFRHMVAAFHYMFNHEYRHMPMRYPDKMIDTQIYLLDNHGSDTFGKKIAYEEMDWIYILNRATRQTSHRYDEAKAALKTFADRYVPYLLSVDHINDDAFNDLHWLFGMLCSLAELQSALPGYIFTEEPMFLALDRRPFI